MKCSRRAEGIKECRAIFRRAREDQRSNYHVSHFWYYEYNERESVFVTITPINSCLVSILILATAVKD